MNNFKHQPKIRKKLTIILIGIIVILIGVAIVAYGAFLIRKAESEGLRDEMESALITAIESGSVLKEICTKYEITLEDQDRINSLSRMIDKTSSDLLDYVDLDSINHPV